MENEELFTLLANRSPLDLASIEKLHTWNPRVYYSKNEIVMSPGDIPDCVWFIEKGSAAGYYFEGRQKITSFFRYEGHLMIPANGLSAEPSKIYIKMLEQSVMRMIPFDHLTGLRNTFPGSNAVIDKLLAEHNQVLKIERIDPIMAMMPEVDNEIYRPLPAEDLKSASKSMATYLGMSFKSFQKSRGL
jgi:hypothetical protein